MIDMKHAQRVGHGSGSEGCDACWDTCGEPDEGFDRTFFFLFFFLNCCYERPVH